MLIRALWLIQALWLTRVLRPTRSLRRAGARYPAAQWAPPREVQPVAREESSALPASVLPLVLLD